MKCLPSGRKVTHLWVVSPFALSSFVTGSETPPEAETRWIGSRVLGAKRMTPSLLHAPLLPLGASQIVTGGAPEISTLFSFPSPKKATDRLSGDQKARDPSSVPGSTLASRLSSARSQRAGFPPAVVAEKVM